ncbi:hypothetical protein [Pseudonocardia sp. MH-G8]|uniref:hypothetical protein n=1 Tax=Pseudonocardia sp. MH-G8 TaxID=1854588 RepID=UPI000BA0FBF1|nr:hypothetical protein [Pseudonocardia sp. MH-G8]OZM76386.1 hypothetical protein CFP66_41360 [Pseudonocardia sp. MH-G8]
MPKDAQFSHGSREAAAAVWSAAGAAHLWVALDASRAGIVGATVSAVLAAAAAVGVVALVIAKRPGTLLAAAVTGSLGVASFLVPMVAGVPGFGDVLPTWNNPWPFIAFLLDALVVRLAVYALRRAARVHPA